MGIKGRKFCNQARRDFRYYWQKWLGEDHTAQDIGQGSVPQQWFRYDQWQGSPVPGTGGRFSARTDCERECLYLLLHFGGKPQRSCQELRRHIRIRRTEEVREHEAEELFFRDVSEISLFYSDPSVPGYYAH